MDIFDKNNKLDCSVANPNFLFLVSIYWQMLSDSILLIKEDRTELTKLVLSETVQKFFPKEPSSLNLLPEAKIFIGKHAKQFSTVYFELVELWKLIQDDSVSFLTGYEYKTDHKKLENNLSELKKELEEILEDLGIKS